MGRADVVERLGATEQEEIAADRKLRQPGVGGVNRKAA